MPTREQQLKAAIEQARIPARDYRVYHALLGRAQWGTAVIPARFQPRSVEEVARLAKVAVSTAERAVGHLAMHGWLAWGHADTRGAPNVYTLLSGSDCDCRTGKPARLADAERARRYRRRRKTDRRPIAGRSQADRTSDQSTDRPPPAANLVSPQESVTVSPQIPVTAPRDFPSESRDISPQNRVSHHVKPCDDFAGQGRFHAKEGRDEGRGGGGWPAGSIGESVSPWPPAHIPGVSGPVPAGTQTRRAVRLLADVLGPVTILRLDGDTA